jgi:hypothetical protein
MIRSPGGTGFDGRVASFASSRLTHAVAGSLGALSLCLIVTLTVLSIKAGIAMPTPV